MRAAYKLGFLFLLLIASMGFSYSAYAQDTDADQDGVGDSVDVCPQTPGLTTFQGCPDADNDGVPEPQDQCPGQAGIAALAGCPELPTAPPIADSDGDGITDNLDRCPNESAPGSGNGCGDPDGDFIANDGDVCPNEAGPAENGGCPVSAPMPSATASGRMAPTAPSNPSDMAAPPTPTPTLITDVIAPPTLTPTPMTNVDDLSAAEDQCPIVPGVNEDGDCFHLDDQCPQVAGSALGCPDPDGDGFPFPQDQCPDQPGVLSDLGCPEGTLTCPVNELDIDGDCVPNIFDIDKCPTVPGEYIADASLLGCPTPTQQPVDPLVTDDFAAETVCYLAVIQTTVDVYQLPNTDAPIIGTLQAGQVVQAVARVIGSGAFFYQLELGGHVRADAVFASQFCGLLPTLSINADAAPVEAEGLLIALENAEPITDIGEITLGTEQGGISLLLPAVQPVREAAARSGPHCYEDYELQMSICYEFNRQDEPTLDIAAATEDGALEGSYEDENGWWYCEESEAQQKSYCTLMIPAGNACYDSSPSPCEPVFVVCDLLDGTCIGINYIGVPEAGNDECLVQQPTAQAPAVGATRLPCTIQGSLVRFELPSRTPGVNATLTPTESIFFTIPTDARLVDADDAATASTACWSGVPSSGCQVGVPGIGFIALYDEGETACYADSIHGRLCAS